MVWLLITLNDFELIHFNREIILDILTRAIYKYVLYVFILTKYSLTKLQQCIL